MHGFTRLDAIDVNANNGRINKRPFELTSELGPSKRIRLATESVLLGAESNVMLCTVCDLIIFLVWVLISLQNRFMPPGTSGHSPSPEPSIPSTSMGNLMDVDFDEDTSMDDLVLDQYGQPMKAPEVSDENSITDELAHALLRSPLLKSTPLPFCEPMDFWFWRRVPVLVENQDEARESVAKRSTDTPSPEPAPGVRLF